MVSFPNCGDFWLIMRRWAPRDGDRVRYDDLELVERCVLDHAAGLLDGTWEPLN